MIIRIENLCKENGLTLTSLERKLGLGKSTIRKWETNAPSVDKVCKVANFFDVSVDYILMNTDNRQVFLSVTGDSLPSELSSAGATEIIFAKGDLERMSEDDLRRIALDALEEIERRNNT